jgi:hypothetical protein
MTSYFFAGNILSDPRGAIEILVSSLNVGRDHATSCGAAIRVKPKARLCEPWGHAALIDRAPEGR